MQLAWSGKIQDPTYINIRLKKKGLAILYI